jgi:hypothetical protein
MCLVQQGVSRERARVSGWILCCCCCCCAAAAAAMLAAADANASQLVDRNAAHVSLAVNAAGEAMLTYEKGGRVEHVLAWGATNALPPTADAEQVAFRLDYSGGYGKYRRQGYWATGGWVCVPYDGPPLAWALAACNAPDGTHWAVQAWQRDLPDLGVRPTPEQAAWELRLSHWSGDLPALSVTLDWSYRRFEHLFGTLTYLGVGVYGFRSTPAGRPLDGFGRNVYVDTFDSAYGRGWRRENSFLTHRPGGSFCYGFYAHGNRPSGAGVRYRATVIGPGVTPDVMWQGTTPGAYDAARDAAANALEKGLGDAACNL